MKRTIDARTGLEVIAPDECRRLLGGDVVGRLAIVDGGSPAIFPVNYALDGEAIVFRTAPGTKLRWAPVAGGLRGRRLRPHRRTGWAWSSSAGSRGHRHRQPDPRPRHPSAGQPGRRRQATLDGSCPPHQRPAHRRHVVTAPAPPRSPRRTRRWCSSSAIRLQGQSRSTSASSTSAPRGPAPGVPRVEAEPGCPTPTSAWPTSSAPTAGVRHMVVMRRMPPERRLSTLVAGGGRSGALWDLAHLIAAFHARADVRGRRRRGLARGARRSLDRQHRAPRHPDVVDPRQSSGYRHWPCLPRRPPPS